MKRYEGLFIFPPEQAAEALKEEENRLEEALRRFGGRSVERRDGGRRPLGYPLKKFREGRVLLWNFEMETHQVGEFRKALELNEKILKLTIVKTPLAKPVKETKKKPWRPKESVNEGRGEIHARES